VQALREQNQIHIWLDGDADARRTLLTLIRTQFEDIHASFARLAVTEWIPYPSKPNYGVTYTSLLRRLEVDHINYYDYDAEVKVDVLALLDSLETPVDRLERRLHRTLNQRFSFGELRTLVELDLGWDYEDVELENSSKADFVRELIKKCQRQGMLGRLEQLAQRR
jgi:hypothetical protein